MVSVLRPKFEISCFGLGLRDLVSVSSLILKLNHDHVLLVLQIWSDSEPLRDVGRSHVQWHGSRPVATITTIRPTTAHSGVKSVAFANYIIIR